MTLIFLLHQILCHHKLTLLRVVHASKFAIMKYLRLNVVKLQMLLIQAIHLNYPLSQQKWMTGV